MILLIVLLIVIVLGTGPWYPYSRSWGYGPSGLVTLILLCLLIYMLFGNRGVI
jgi:hypothetical protein